MLEFLASFLAHARYGKPTKTQLAACRELAARCLAAMRALPDEPVAKTRRRSPRPKR